MEIKATLNKPYTDKQRVDFIVLNNHEKGYEIQETEDGIIAVYNEPLPPTAEELKQARIKELQQYLSETDWYAIRESETGVDIPAEVKKARADARAEISSLRGDEEPVEVIEEPLVELYSMEI